MRAYITVFFSLLIMVAAVAVVGFASAQSPTRTPTTAPGNVLPTRAPATGLGGSAL